MMQYNLNNSGGIQIKTALLLLISALVLGAAVLFFTGWLKISVSFGNKHAETQQSSSAKPGERKILFYRNPMNPVITSPVPAKDEMGMDYIPVYSDEGTAPKKTLEEEVDDFFAEDSSPKEIPGLAPVTLSPQEIQVAGVVTAAAVSEPFQSIIRTVGQVIPDETRVRRVQTKIEGWVEKLYVNYTGQSVKQGDPLLSVYSPDLLSGQEEFLQAKASASKMLSASDPETRKTGEMLLKAARGRLELFDVPEVFIQDLLKIGKMQRAVTLTVPFSGFVIAKDVLEGQKIDPGMSLLTIADLSTVWVEADFYEYEAEAVKTGLGARLSSPYAPGVTLQGEVSYVYPFLNAESRTLKARMEFSNEKLQLRPGMFVDVNLEIDLGESVVIPDSAVMDSGTRKVVFVDKGSGRFEPREIQAGARSAGRAQILSGIKPGERVAVKANFLLDSESRLQAIIQEKTKGGRGQ